MAEKPSNIQFRINSSSSCSHSPPNTPTESLSAYFWASEHQAKWEIQPWQDYSVGITLALLMLCKLWRLYLWGGRAAGSAGWGKWSWALWEPPGWTLGCVLKLKDKSSSSSSPAEQLRKEVWCARALLGLALPSSVAKPGLNSTDFNKILLC